MTANTYHLFKDYHLAHLEKIEIEIKFGCCKKLHMLSHNKALVSKKRCNVAFCVQYKWGVWPLPRFIGTFPLILHPCRIAVARLCWCDAPWTVCRAQYMLETQLVFCACQAHHYQCTTKCSGHLLQDTILATLRISQEQKRKKLGTRKIQGILGVALLTALICSGMLLVQMTKEG